MRGVGARRCYRLLLLLLPRDLRTRFGPDMEQLFADRLAEVRDLTAKANLWGAAVGDVLIHALLERTSQLCTLARRTRFLLQKDAMIAQDIKHAIHRWRRQPLFAAAVAVILALAMGVNIAVFALVDASLVRPLPFEAGHELVHFWQENRSDGSLTNFSYPIFADLGERSRAMNGIAAYHSPSMTLTKGDAARSVESVRVSPNFFDLLGVQPVLGRGFRADDAAPSSDRVVIVGDGFWRTELGGDPDILGRALVLDGASYAVIGVLPRGFVFPRERSAEVWRPLIPNEREANTRGFRSMHIIGRLRSRVDIAAAQSEMDRIAADLEVEAPEANGGRGVRLISMRDQVVGDTRTPIVAVYGAVVLVLLITCSNLAHLTFVRLIGRSGELGVRKALGATRGQLVRHLMIEVLMLFLIGGAAGAMLASWLLDAIPALLPPDAMAQAPFLGSLSVDGGVLVYALALSLVGGIAFGLVPALHVAALERRDALTAPRAVISRGGLRLLVGSQVAIAVTLLASTLLLVRSSLALFDVDPGFDADNLLTLRISLPGTAFSQPERITQFNDELVRRVESLPGVAGAAAVDRIPLSGNLATTTVSVPEEDAEAERRAANQHLVSPEYFEVMGMQLVRGRPLASNDDAEAPMVVVINELLASVLFADRDPVGRQLNVGAGAEMRSLEIVGVMADVKVHTIEEPPAPALYISVAQLPSNSTGLVVRTRTRPDALVSAVRGQVASIDPSLDIYEVSSMRELIDRSPEVLKRTIPALLLSGFAALATILVGVGIFAVVGRDVASRTRELGVRRAIGARSADIIRDITASTFITVGCGIAVGCALAIALARLLQSLLFGVGAADPAALLATSLTILFVSGLACVGPVRRALGIYPTEVLRAD